jgi:hypothetical protein
VVALADFFAKVLLRADLYAIAALAGAAVVVIGDLLRLPPTAGTIAGGSPVLRIARYGYSARLASSRRSSAQVVRRAPGTCCAIVLRQNAPEARFSQGFGVNSERERIECLRARILVKPGRVVFVRRVAAPNGIFLRHALPTSVFALCLSLIPRSEVLFQRRA